MLTSETGAPECYRSDEFLEQAQLRIKQNVDIWSLGGIFSEAAIWIAYGYSEGIIEYRRSRKDETDRIQGFRDGDCFHDGEKVLRAVLKWHKDILPILRNSDKITASVLNMVEVDMLVLSDARSQALQLWHKCQGILEKARREVDLQSSPTRNEIASKEPPPRPPPQMPPSPHPPPRPIDSYSTRSKHSQRQVSWDQSPESYGGRRDHSPDRETMFDGEGSARSDGSNTLDGRSEYWEASRYEYPGRRPQSSVQRSRDEWGHHHRSDPSANKSTRSSYRPQSSDEARSERKRTSLPASIGSAQYDRKSQESGEMYREDDVIHQSTGGEPSSEGGRSRRGQPERRSTRKSLPPVNESSGDSYDAGGSSMTPNRTSVVHHSGPSRETALAVRPGVPPSAHNPQIPFLSVGAALLWKTQSQSRMRFGFGSSKIRLGHTPEPLPHQYLQRRLEKRDQVGLVVSWARLLTKCNRHS